MPEKNPKRTRLIYQIAVLFIVAVILVTSLSAFYFHKAAIEQVYKQFNDRSTCSARDLETYLKQYPAYEWLIQYWYDHYSELDIEYDLDYRQDVTTAEKVRKLTERHPKLRLEYVKPYEIAALPAADQKLYAEIIYSWLITRIDQMADSYDLDYLYCLGTEDPFDKQQIIFIAADDEKERGEDKGQLYPIGTILESTPEQQEAIRKTINGKPQTIFNADGKYLDFYYRLDSIRGLELLVGFATKFTAVHESIDRETMILSLITATFLVVLALICMSMINQVVIRPLELVEHNIRLYKTTKNGETVRNNLSKLRSHNELAKLGADVSDLTLEMGDYMNRIETITAEKQRITTELGLAGRIQTSMLPMNFDFDPPRKEFAIYASMDPAKEVGGDFYDFVMIDDDHLIMLIADVSDKGIPAALFMMACKITLIHNIKTIKDSPARILKKTNQAICAHNPEDMFVTIWLGILDLKDGTLRCSNAGHEYPILKQPEGSFELVHDKHGLVIGSYEESLYPEYTLKLEKGSTLFVYTDGLPEASDVNGKQLGIERVLELLNRNPDKTPKEVLDSMKKAVADYTKDREPFDDLTMLCLRYNGPADEADKC
jgi:serine phosphatase RsbU (regulator of sigma subunit)